MALTEKQTRNTAKEGIDVFKQQFLSRKSKLKRQTFWIRCFEFAFVAVGCYIILRNFDLF